MCATQRIWAAIPYGFCCAAPLWRWQWNSNVTTSCPVLHAKSRRRPGGDAGSAARAHAGQHAARPAPPGVSSCLPTRAAQRCGKSGVLARRAQQRVRAQNAQSGSILCQLPWSHRPSERPVARCRAATRDARLLPFCKTPFTRPPSRTERPCTARAPPWRGRGTGAGPHP
jgi:hypothetical protein